MTSIADAVKFLPTSWAFTAGLVDHDPDDIVLCHPMYLQYAMQHYMTSHHTTIHYATFVLDPGDQ